MSLMKQRFVLTLQKTLKAPRLWLQRLRLAQKASALETMQTGKFYNRLGTCNGCGDCCKDIHLIFNGESIKSREQFETVKTENPEYQYFIPHDEDESGLVFSCSNLQLDNTCAIYENRPMICRDYPNEYILLQGTKLSANCSYVFELRKTFQQHLIENYES